MGLLNARLNVIVGSLAIGVAGVLASVAGSLVASLAPGALRGSLWIVVAIAVFFATCAGMFFFFRWVLPSLTAGLLVIFAPAAVSERVPRVMARTSDDDPDSIGDVVASQLLARLMRPAFPGLIAEYEDLRSRSVPEHRTTSQAAVTRFIDRWRSAGVLRVVAPASVTYADPVHGTITFDREFEDLLTHPLLQRLNEIRQLAFAFPRYPGGTHTRFSHSVGVAHLARAAVKRVLDAGVLFTEHGYEAINLPSGGKERLVKVATICGLVHDLGHPPLGHTLDRFFRTKYFAGEGTSDADKSFLPTLLSHLADSIAAVGGLDTEDVGGILSGVDLSGWDVFVSELVNSRLDVDRMDYLQRDAHFTGQQEGLLNIDALLAAIRPYKVGNNIFLTFDEASLSDVEQFVYARDVMYLRCYEHRSKVVSEALALRSVRDLFENNPTLATDLPSFALLSDGQLIELLAEFANPTTASSEAVRMAFRSGALFYEQVDSVPFSEGFVEGWLESLLGDFTYQSESLLEKIEETEKRIAIGAGIDPQDVVLVLPDPKANEERSAGLDIKILTQVSGGYKAIPLLNEQDDKSPSEVLKRRKYVAKELVDAAGSLEEVRNAAARGISLLGIIRSARFRLRLFVHNKSLHATDVVRDTFWSLGVRDRGN
jgi:HD superfamily phosphohydrolase